ncbi:hypothetical protein F5144DRAFT_589315 [Chaetomium tenue]|uniref:Uncharacterized protein n=1 Tax=Chaetomium tenue TaxID=1854479 RepID=A0ACB7PQ53_9PEZI|nr:hypothetical protein F5144DRAFT_589315 [Chaetomium globosum]
MAPLVAPLLRRGSVCRSCLFTLAKGVSPIQRRNVTNNWYKKQGLALVDWEKRAEEIKKGNIPNTWDILEERGYVKDITGSRETIREIMRLKRVKAYVGVDPTASSLHVGHLLPLMPLFWMYMHGYGAFTLLGGSTVKIGDPTDRLKDREPIAKADLAMNVTKMHFQLKKLWANVESQARRYGYEKEWAWQRAVVNNNTWWNKVTLLEVLRRAGRHMRIGPMLSRETVKRKMSEGDGMSFAEFTYPIMQGWDWWTLFNQQRVQMQIGGSDQYGNIVAGIDIVKTVRDSEPDEAKRIPRDGPIDDPVGFTVPLLLDSSGAKFGKSAGNAVWLDQFMTSTFDLYGYFVRRPDDDVEKLLKLFTFMPLEAIQKVMAQQMEDPSKRVAQHCLAFEVLTLVHGEEAAREARQQHQMMYNKVPLPVVAEAPGAEYEPPVGPTTLNNAPRIDMKLPRSLVMGKSIGRILYAAGLASSSSDGHRLAAQKAAYIGGMPGRRPGKGEPMDPSQLSWNPVTLWFPQETGKYLIDDKLLILRKGKHNVRIIHVVPDAEYEESGEQYPGMLFKGRIRELKALSKDIKEGRKTPEEMREYASRLAETYPSRKPPPESKLRAELKSLYRIEMDRQEGEDQEGEVKKQGEDEGSERP